jgi:hypothetical protein
MTRQGFYVSIERDQGRGREPRRGLLLGPYDTKDAAGALVWRGRQLAPRVDPRAEFDAYGVTRVQMKPGHPLPQGKLNATLAAEIRSERCEPTAEADTYLRRIRNPGKAGHAQAVWEALCLGEPLPARPAELSVMAAQAVELRLADLVKAKRDPAPCQARGADLALCGRPATDPRHTRLGHPHQPPTNGEN